MAKGFRNYNFEFDKNEKKILVSLCKKVVKEVQGKKDYYRIERAFTGMLEKLNSGEEPVRLTKDEYIQMSMNLRENVKFMNDKMKNTWFLMRWIYKSMVMQYSNIYEKYFSD